MEGELPEGRISTGCFSSQAKETNRVAYFKTSGRVLRGILGYMLEQRRKDYSFAGWEIFSGLRYVASSDALIGERKIGQIQIQTGDDDTYEDLDDNVEYNCAGSEAVARGGYGFQFGSIDITLGGSVNDALTGYFQRHEVVSVEDPGNACLSRQCYELPEFSWVKIGYSAFGLDATSCAHDTCEYGRVLTEAIRDRGVELGQKTEISFWSGTDMIGGLMAGDITAGAIISGHSIDKRVVYFTASGSYLQSVVEKMIQDHGDSSGTSSAKWVIFAGLRFQAVFTGLSWRVTQIQVQTDGVWGNIRYDSEYRIAAPVYLVMQGGTYFTEFTGSYKIDRTQRLCMLDYIVRHPSVDALPDESSCCFGSAECPWSAEPQGVEWNEPLLADPDTVLGDSSGIKGCSQTNEVASCEYGSLVTDVIRETGRKAGLNTQVALWNIDSFATGLPAGPVKAADILSMHQDGDRIVFFSLKGSVLREVIEHMLAQLGDGTAWGSPGWLAFGGLRFASTRSSRRRHSRRGRSRRGGWSLGLVQIQEGDSDTFTDLDETLVYEVAGSERLLRGGDGYSFGVYDYTPGCTLREAVAEYAQSHSPVVVLPQWKSREVCMSERCPWIESTSRLFAREMFKSLPESVQRQVVDNPAALAPMFALVLLMVIGSAIVLVHKFSRRYNRVSANDLEDEMLE
jgi:2',3'-cyclic-nucleotide 2'-phosphodiesterase (5'-nucleotidase family)